MDPNTLNLDLDPEFWPNLDPDPGLCYKFLKEKLKNTVIFKENHFFFLNGIILTKRKCHRKKLVS